MHCLPPAEGLYRGTQALAWFTPSPRFIHRYTGSCIVYHQVHTEVLGSCMVYPQPQVCTEADRILLCLTQAPGPYGGTQALALYTPNPSSIQRYTGSYFV